MTEKPELEELLKIILAISGGLDESSIEKIREISRQIAKNPEYNQVKTLEHAMQSLFDKLYSVCPAKIRNYEIKCDSIKVDTDFEIAFNQFSLKGSGAAVTLDFLGFRLLDRMDVDEEAVGHLWKYVALSLENNTFNKAEFAKKLTHVKKINSKYLGFDYDSFDKKEIFETFRIE